MPSTDLATDVPASLAASWLGSCSVHAFMSLDGTYYCPFPPRPDALPVVDQAEAQRALRKAVPQVGTIVGGVYRILGELGSGAMGIVLLAKDVTLGRRVAIKFVHRDLLDSEFRLRLTTEAQAMVASAIRTRSRSMRSASTKGSRTS